VTARFKEGGSTHEQASERFLEMTTYEAGVEAEPKSSPKFSSSKLFDDDDDDTGISKQRDVKQPAGLRDDASETATPRRSTRWEFFPILDNDGTFADEMKQVDKDWKLVLHCVDDARKDPVVIDSNTFHDVITLGVNRGRIRGRPATAPGGDDRQT